MSKYPRRVTSVNRGRARHRDQNNRCNYYNRGNYYSRDNWDNKAPEGGDGGVELAVWEV